MKKITLLTLFTILCFGLQAQFTTGIYGGTQYNFLKETKTIYHQSGHLMNHLFLKPSYGIIIGLQAQKALWDYLVLSNETGYSLQNYERDMGSAGQDKGELLSHHFINTGLMAGIKPLAQSEYLIRGVEVKTGIILKYLIGSEMDERIIKYPKLNYSVKVALSYKINTLGVQLFMTRQLNTFHGQQIPGFAKWEYHLHAYGLQVSYDLF